MATPWAFFGVLAARSAVVSRGAALWPPSLQGDPDTWGDFDPEWHVLSGDMAAHSAWGGRTLARRAEGEPASRLALVLPGTFTIPSQFSMLLKYSAEQGFDTIGLDYAWGPAPDSARSAACAASTNCGDCQTNYLVAIQSGGGDDLILGRWPVFGDEIRETLRFTHFFAFGVEFIPEARLPDNLTSPVPQLTRDYIDNMSGFAIEPLLSRVLGRLGWQGYLADDSQVLWSKIFVAGHSQGASHAGFAALRRPVLGALLLSGPQDMCGDDGAAEPPPAERRVVGCYAADEPNALAIESNLQVFSEHRAVTTSGGARMAGNGTWCPPPAHCATAVDDQLVEAAADQCFGFLSDSEGQGFEATVIAFSTKVFPSRAFAVSFVAALAMHGHWVRPLIVG